MGLSGKMNPFLYVCDKIYLPNQNPFVDFPCFCFV